MNLLEAVSLTNFSALLGKPLHSGDSTFGKVFTHSMNPALFGLFGTISLFEVFPFEVLNKD